MKVQFRFEGGKELAAALAQLPERVGRKVVTEVLMDVAEPMRARMARLAPRGHEAPHLADNIVISSVRAKRDDFGSLSAPSVAIGPARGFQHGALQEWGTAHHPSQPFARPAFDFEAPKALPEISRRIWVELAAKKINRPTVTDGGPVTGGPGGGLL